MTLEQELNDVLRAARLDAKQGRAVARRLGWDGRPRSRRSRRPVQLRATRASEFVSSNNGDPRLRSC